MNKYYILQTNDVSYGSLGVILLSFDFKLKQGRDLKPSRSLWRFKA